MLLHSAGSSVARNVCGLLTRAPRAAGRVLFERGSSLENCGYDGALAPAAGGLATRAAFGPFNFFEAAFDLFRLFFWHDTGADKTDALASLGVCLGPCQCACGSERLPVRNWRKVARWRQEGGAGVRILFRSVLDFFQF